MREFVTLQQRIAPEIIDTVERRYALLRTVSHVQPVGRRGLAGVLRMGERQVRSEIDFLKEQGLLESDTSGVKVTDEGEEFLIHLSEYMKSLHGLTDAEDLIARSLGLKKVIIVPGNIDEDNTVKRELGRAASRYIRDVLKPGNVLALTGGTTLQEVVATMPRSNAASDVLVVPARGGLGEDVEVQANTIAAIMAKKINGSYKLLHVPDNITEQAMRLLLTDPHINELVQKIKNADVLVHGIGNAEELSVSRGDSPEQTRELMEQGAVGEAFGHYFAKDGSIVRNIHSLGIKLNDFNNIPLVVGVAGGKRKAAAILAVFCNKYEDVLITDQGAANHIVEFLRR